MVSSLPNLHLDTDNPTCWDDLNWGTLSGSDLTSPHPSPPVPGDFPLWLPTARHMTDASGDRLQRSEVTSREKTLSLIVICYEMNMLSTRNYYSNS